MATRYPSYVLGQYLNVDTLLSFVYGINIPTRDMEMVDPAMRNPARNCCRISPTLYVSNLRLRTLFTIVLLTSNGQFSLSLEVCYRNLREFVWIVSWIKRLREQSKQRTRQSGSLSLSDDSNELVYNDLKEAGTTFYL